MPYWLSLDLLYESDSTLGTTLPSKQQHSCKVADLSSVMAWTAMLQSALSHPVALLVLAVLAVVVAPWARNRWKWRHIPGPFSLPLVGDLPGIISMGMHEYMDMCRKKYGKVFKIYVGKSMQIVVADPEVARRLNYKMLNRNFRQLRIDDEDDEINSSGLVVARDEKWRTLRLAWQPAFQSGSLEGYSSLMDNCAVQLAQHLRKVGESGQVVEIWRELGRMTLQVVGTTAYGVDFHTMPEKCANASEEEQGIALMRACQTVFSAGSVSQGSIYILLDAMLPFSGFVSWMARNFPDSRLIKLMEARKIVRELSMKLINGWRSPADGTPAAPAGPDIAETMAANASETPLVETISATVNPSAAATNPQANGTSPQVNGSADGHAKTESIGDVRAYVKRSPGMGVSPGSFLGLMLSARDRSSGSKLTDPSLVAQSNTFILAGYETTANTLSFCIYNIALHKQVQDRLLVEIDAYGRDKSPAFAELDKFPYAEAIVREALRLYPPATMLVREVKEAGFDISPKVHVPAKQSVFSFLYGYQRDPEYWPEAHKFRPERWLPEGAYLAPTTPDAWTPFGTGPRMCIGWKFALQEAKIALVRLYQDQTYELEPGQVPLALRQNITLSPKHGVKVRVVPRN